MTAWKAAAGGGALRASLTKVDRSPRLPPWDVRSNVNAREIASAPPTQPRSGPFSEEKQMARRGGPIEVEIGDDAFHVRAWGRSLTIPFVPAPKDAEDDADLLVSLDEIEHWDAPEDGVLIELEEIAKILEAIERECDKRRLFVAFE
jgi:hypothetical protein